MLRLRVLLMALIVSTCIVAAPLRADDAASTKLSNAIKLHDQGDYEGARSLLVTINDKDLKTEDEQLLLQRYLALSAKGIAGVAEAQRDFDAGSASLADNKLEEARKSFDAVLKNPYAPGSLLSKAQTHLRTISNKTNPPPVAVAPAGPALNDGNIVDQLARERELLWQKTIATYKATDRKIRQAVLAENFAEAERLMQFAKETIEANRRYASPPSRYEDLRNQARELESFIEDEKREYEEQMIVTRRTEAEKANTIRIERVTQQKQRQIDQLMDRVVDLQKEGRLEEAIQVLTQVLAIDPNNDQAAWKRQTLEDVVANTRSIDANKARSSESQDVLAATDEAGIPWHDDIRYPKNWPEITSRRGGAEEATDTEENRKTRRQLEKVAPEIKFDATPFEEVIKQLRAYTGLNIVPNWSAMEAAAIEKDAEVTMNLKDVKFEKALRLILSEIGGGEVELAYEIDDGVVQISTKEDLSRRTMTRVYNVQDLLITVPTFRGRQINLESIGQQQQQGGLGGGRFLLGQGGNAGGNQGNIFQGGGNQNEENDQNQPDPLQPLLELIQATIDPESWREAGGNVGSISALQQQVIVTQTSTAHNSLRDLLRQLRQSRALQIAIEARYITITRNWLEQIGVDLDVILNNGNAGYDRTSILNPATNNPVLVPRQFTRNGFTPGAPGGVGITQPTQPFGQVFGQPGLVPAVGDAGPHSGQMTPVPLVNNTMNLAAPSDTNINGSLGSLGNQTPAFQIFGSFLDNIQVDFLLRASQIDKRSSELDAPRLVLFNGQRATFESFIEQDYIAALTPIIGDNAGAFLPNIGTALTGRSLDVQATVSADRRYVTMTVRTFTRVTGNFRTVFFGGSQTVGSGFVELATQTTQQVRTTVSVPDGGTLLIGGLKQSGERDIDAGVPILSRIPILKRAFSNQSNVKDDQVLLILIKPTIIIQEEAEADQFPSLVNRGT